MVFSSRAEYAELTGLDLGEGWSLGPFVEQSPDATGSAFSVAFVARSETGGTAFCKVLDLTTAAQQPDPLKAIEHATKAFNYEWQLLKTCGEYGLRRIVHALHAGEARDPRAPLNLVPFIVFEQAEGDLRRFLDDAASRPLHKRLELLHHAALGLRELHGLRIAHQDLKPSNLLYFEPHSAVQGKLGDLGRASKEGDPALHDDARVAGAIAYAPPELLYNDLAAEFSTRRLSCDLYQLGALIAFVMSEVSVNGELYARLSDAMHWRNWGGAYADVLPAVRSALVDVMEMVGLASHPQLSGEIVKLVADLCTADPSTRGKRLLGKSSGNQVAVLSRAVTRLDLLAKTAKVRGLEAA